MRVQRLLLVLGSLGLLLAGAGCRGEDGASCSVSQNADGSVTITCEDGTSVTVPGPDDGDDGTSCTVTGNGDGTSTIRCEDGTEVMGAPNPGYWGRLCLIIGRGPEGQIQEGSCFPLYGDAVVLGRERGDILFSEDGYVSGTHARLSYRGGRVYLQDLASSNGTYLKLAGERVVAPGTFLLLGQQLFRISLT